MKIFFDNVNFKSNSGPNSFSRKLAQSLIDNGHFLTNNKDADLQLSFIQSVSEHPVLIQRLDGIYFNSEQDWNELNRPIKETYERANGVIFQSYFNKALSEKYFGQKENSCVIHNGADLAKISHIPVLDHPVINKFEHVWACASSWRPHKRLSENVRYFIKNSSEDDCLVIAGDNPDYQVNHERIFYVGKLNWEQLVSLYKKSKYFLHLALMDHCPNVVVDARASGCQIICANSGGTKEIAGPNAIVIKDIDWDFKPFKLYNPPPLDFSCIENPFPENKDIDIHRVSEMYVEFFKDILRWD